MKRTMVVGLMLLLGGLMACNKDSAGSGATASDTVTSGGGGGDSIGVKECDEYIAKWNSCYKDPQVKAAAKPGLDQMKTQWASMAKDPNQKAGLAMACKAAVDSFPAAACK